MEIGNKKMENVNKWVKKGAWVLAGIFISAAIGILWVKKSGLIREGEPFAGFMTRALTVFLVYLSVSIFWRGKIVRHWYMLVEILQNFYIEVGDALGKKLSEKITLQIREKMRTACFTLMFLLMIVMDVKSRNQFKAESKFWVVLFGILIFTTGILSWREPLQKRKWKSNFTAIWLLLWSMVSVSDLLVRKSFSYTGYVMLLCVGFSFFIWQNTGETKTIIRTILLGLEWTLPLVAVYCVYFRAKTPGILYNGCFTNRESMALYSLTLFIAFLGNFHEIFGEKKVETVQTIAFGVGLSLSCYYLYYTKVSGCLLAAFAVAVVWLIFQRKQIKSILQKGRKLIVLLGTSVVLSLGLVVLVNAGSKVLPEKIGYPVSYAKEVEESDTAVEREWEEKKNIWKEYSRECNLIGNKDALKKSGKTKDASNGFLQMMQRYGIFIIIPYVFLLICCVWKIRKEKEFEVVAVIVAFVITMLLQNVEIPFTNGLWLVFYLMIGRFLEKNLEVGS